MVTYKNELSKREVALLSKWERERRSFVTIDAIREAVGTRAANHVAKALARKGVLQRLQRGIYLLRPLRALLTPTASSAPAAVGALLHAEPYYIGGLWAFTFHRITAQQYVSLIDAFVTRTHRVKLVSGARIRYHVLPFRSFSHGTLVTAIEGVSVVVSDLERTLLDALDFPRTVGGVDRAKELFDAGHGRADDGKLVDYAIRGARASTRQRLGVLLERAKASRRNLARLLSSVRGTRSSLSMIPAAPRQGPFNATWQVVENDR